MWQPYILWMMKAWADAEGLQDATKRTNPDFQDTSSELLVVNNFKFN